jgi:hypothetical protein
LHQKFSRTCGSTTSFIILRLGPLLSGFTFWNGRQVFDPTAISGFLYSGHKIEYIQSFGASTGSYLHKPRRIIEVTRMRNMWQKCLYWPYNRRHSCACHRNPFLFPIGKMTGRMCRGFIGMDSCDKHRNDEVGGYILDIFAVEITLPFFISGSLIHKPPVHRFLIIELKPDIVQPVRSV